MGPEAVGADICRLAGADALIARAREHLDAGRPLQAIHLAEIVAGVDDGHPGARAVLADAHRRILTGSVNFWERAWLSKQIERYS